MPVTYASPMKVITRLTNKMSGSASVGEGKNPTFETHPARGSRDLLPPKKHPPAESSLSNHFHSLRRFCHRAPADWHVVDRLGSSVVPGHDIFRISRESVLVQIESFDFALSGDSQRAGGLDRVHKRHRSHKGRDRDREAADHLRDQHSEAAAVKETRHYCTDVCAGRRGCAIFAGGEQAQRKCAPDSAHHMYRNSADR